MTRTTPPEVVVVGSVNVDVVTELERLPRAGETVLATAMRRNVGGKGANQAVAAHIVCGTARFVGRVGDDADGAFLREGLLARGVDVAALRTAPGHPSGAAFIQVADGDNTIVVAAGANRAWVRLADDDVASVRSAAVVVCQMEIPDAIVDDAAAHTRGRFVLNAAPAGDVSVATLRRCDPLVVNEHELARIADRRVDGPDSAIAAARVLRERGARSVVATLGGAGAVWVDDTGHGHRGAPPTDVVDTTGAGDVFVGVVAARLADGAGLASAVTWAVAAASLSVRTVGTIDSYPDRADIQAAAASLDGSSHAEA